MTTETIHSIIVSAGIVLSFVTGAAYFCVVAWRDSQDLKRRKARADKRRKENEQLAHELLVEVRAQEVARALVAEQIRDTTPILVPVTHCDTQHRRRILRPEET